MAFHRFAVTRSGRVEHCRNVVLGQGREAAQLAYYFCGVLCRYNRCTDRSNRVILNAQNSIQRLKTISSSSKRWKEDNIVLSSVAFREEVLQARLDEQFQKDDRIPGQPFDSVRAKV